MPSIIEQIKQATATILGQLYTDQQFTADQIMVNETKPEFEGEYAVVLFPFVKSLKANPQSLGTSIGDALKSQFPQLVQQYSIVAGFLNLSIADNMYIDYLKDTNTQVDVNAIKQLSGKVMIEYSSPNTNKPLHFGHLRNNFLGWAVAAILKATGKDVIKANLVNDRGIHICKSMIAWMRYANGATPSSTGIKGDHLVGDYYVQYNDVYKQEVQALMAQGMPEAEAEKQAPIFLEAQELLRKWEAGDAEVYQLWKEMNAWVYEGFDVTYKALGLDFDKYYYESDTYLLGKQLVQEGLDKGILYKKDDGSIWIDLTDEGLDHKLLLRGDGTSVYMTQDLGTAKLKYEDYQLDTSVYVIADEQNYHMQVLKAILTKLGEPCAAGIYHLSYGMVELPSGRMKSREGTVVDADDMIAEMINMAKEQTQEAGKTEGFTEADLAELYNTIGLGALKFYLLRVDPRKKMIFNPKESIDLHGFTAAYIQYVHARISSIIRKVGEPTLDAAVGTSLLPMEKQLLVLIEQYPSIVLQAANDYNPSVICNYCFKLAQTFNSFFDKHSVAKAESTEKLQLRLQIAQFTANVLKHGMQLLGIQLPSKM